MSCQSLSCDADALPNFRHRAVHFTSESDRKSMECNIDFQVDDASDISGSWGPAWSRTMSRSAPAACPAPLLSGPCSLESANGSSSRFPRLEECAHFHYGRVRLGGLQVLPIENDLQMAHQQQEQDDAGWVTISVQPHCDNRVNNSDDSQDCSKNDQDSDNAEWMVTRSAENFKMLDTMLHKCIYDRKVSGLPDLSVGIDRACLEDRSSYHSLIADYLHHFSIIADDTINCGPILNWFQMDNKGHKLLVANEDSNSINTPAVAAAYSVRKYISQARDEISFEVGDMISVIDMPGPSESTWWRGKRGFRVGFFPQECVAVIGDKVPRNMKQPPPIVGSVSVAPIKPVLRKHGKLISLFRSFILSRPSRRSLRQQGILRERVFGCDLGEHLLNSGHFVPQVLSWCASIIEEHGRVDGIYRLSGAASATQRLRLAFDEERPPPNPPNPLDVHAVASLLKMYFRELPNPLCTYQLYSYFVSAVKSKELGDGNEVRRLDDSEKLIRMRETVMKLPPPHYRTLSFLMRHLHGMSLLSDNTGMTARNMGIVWAPNLLRSPLQEFSLSGVAIQVVVTEFLICYADLIFSDEQCCPESSNNYESLDSIDSQISTLVKRPKSLPIATPTKLLSLEEARNKQSLRPSVGAKEPHYIEVGGGPNSLPRYHTIIQLPPGSTKRGLKRSPSGWRGLFFRASKHRSLPSSSHPHPTISEPMKIHTMESAEVTVPNNIADKKSETEEKMTIDMEETRSTRSCESLTSEVDCLPPLIVVPEQNAPSSHHNRSASCDSYFEASLAELAGMRLRLSSQEREMDIFSEDDNTARQGWNKEGTSSEDTTAEPSPIKMTHPTASKSPKLQEVRKSLMIEEQLSDLLFIDCNTPEHTATAMIRARAEAECDKNQKNKSSDSEGEDKFNSQMDMNSSIASSSTIKVKMRERISPRRHEKNNIARHSHCGLTSSPKIETAPQRHSTLIRVDWLDSANLQSENPNLCGYIQLQSDSETSLQTGESKDSLARRLIESKESLSSRNTDEGVNNSSLLTWIQSSHKRNGTPINDDKTGSEGEVEEFSGLITKSSSKDNLDAGNPSNGNDSFKHCVKITHLNESDDRVKKKWTNESIITDDITTPDQDHDYENVSSNASNQRVEMTTSSGSENFQYDDVCIPKSENRCSVTVTPSDENFSSNMADSLEESLSNNTSNISYQNLNRLSMISGESGKVNISKESTPTFSPHEQERTEEIYECFSFARPSYIHLASSSGGSSPTSPSKSKSPLKSTISITYKSPTKEVPSIVFPKSKSNINKTIIEEGLYEDVGEIGDLATIPNSSDASLPTQIADDQTQALLNSTNSDELTSPISDTVNDADIYNKVKFFRQSINEVNSLIMESDIELKDGLDDNERNYENIECGNPENLHSSYENVDVVDLHNKNSSEKTAPLDKLKTSSYENIALRRSEEALEKHKILTKISFCESDKENSDENENISSNCDYVAKRSSVKQLAHKFESPTENKSVFCFDKSSKSSLSNFENNKHKDGCGYNCERNKAVSFCDNKTNGRTIPCFRSRSHRLTKCSNNARSLDEIAFIKEFGHESLHKDDVTEMETNDHNVGCGRRKSLEALKSLNQPKKLPDLNLNTECNKGCSVKSNLSLNLELHNRNEDDHHLSFLNRYASITPTTENKICLVQARLSPKKIKSKQLRGDNSKSVEEVSEEHPPDWDVKDKLSRERIEKYKEERRLFLREKYSSQSFRGVGEQLKIKNDDITFEGVQLRNPAKLERRNTADSAQRNKFSFTRPVAKSSDYHLTDAIDSEESGSLSLSIANSATPLNESSVRIVEGSETRKKPDKKSQELMPKTAPVSYKFDSEIPKTSNLSTMGDDKDMSISGSSIGRKEKRSPSLNIRDMAAMFEQKSLNHGNQNQ